MAGEAGRTGGAAQAGGGVTGNGSDWQEFPTQRRNKSHLAKMRLHSDNMRLHPDEMRLHPGRMKLQSGGMRLHPGRVRLQSGWLKSYPGRIMSHLGKMSFRPGGMVFAFRLSGPRLNGLPLLPMGEDLVRNGLGSRKRPNYIAPLQAYIGNCLADIGLSQASPPRLRVFSGPMQAARPTGKPS